MTAPKFAILSTCDAEDFPVILGVLKHFPDTKIHRVRYGKHKGSSTLWSKWRTARTQRRINSLLFGRSETPSLEELGIPYADIFPAEKLVNTSWAEQLKENPPDVLLTCGAPILKESTFSIPRIVTANLHWGLVPGYRGADAPFWAMYHRDFSKVGISLHKVDRGIDDGTMYAQGAPELSPGDDEATVWAKLTTVAADLALAFLHSVVMDPTFPHREGTPLTEKGRVFLYGQRRMHHDLWLFVQQLWGGVPASEPWRAYNFTTNGYAPTGKE